MCGCVRGGGGRCNWELTFVGGGSSFSVGGEGTPSIPLSRENSAIRETKLGHKTQQNYNSWNYKMHYKSVIIHKNRILHYFQNKIKNLNKYNNNDNNRVIPCQIIQYFWMFDTLTSQILPTLSPPAGNAQIANPRGL